MSRVAAASFIACLLVAGAARPEVLDSQSSGFTVRESRTIAASPEKVWAVLVEPGAWWDPEHTFSHDARNLSLAPKPGGFWQETLPKGGVRHMVVIYVDPPATLRLEGALGPLQAYGVAAHLTFKLSPQAGGTSITETYDVGGHAPGGLDKLAGPVNEVLDQQLGRLKARAEAAGTP
ncbi:MAG TPA: SRPBCC domain-containing protein [Caulobacteraceae bacterium]|nr:SRPBCC domain-containing protein [Caulobacteraceae bacterium]